MRYLVRLTDRALRDMEAIYKFMKADSSENAFVWFNGLAEAIYSLERSPERASVIPEDKKLRHLLFGKKPNTYRIIYAVDKRNNACERSSHPARCESRDLDREREGSLVLGTDGERLAVASRRTARVSSPPTTRPSGAAPLQTERRAATRGRRGAALLAYDGVGYL